MCAPQIRSGLNARYLRDFSLEVVRSTPYRHYGSQGTCQGHGRQGHARSEPEVTRAIQLPLARKRLADLAPSVSFMSENSGIPLFSRRRKRCALIASQSVPWPIFRA